MSIFSFGRFRAVLVKEFIQMRRDRITFGMMIGIPIALLMLFGYAINSDPKHLPTLVEMNDTGPVVRAVVAGMQNSEYFDFRGIASGRAEADRALRDGSANLVVVIPQNFERDLVRGRQPSILIATDASDPTASTGALAAMQGVVQRAMAETMTGPLAGLVPASPPFSIVTHKQFNPEGRTSTNIVPGLLAIILSLTMTLITAVAIVRETERGTMETLISTPVRPVEVMLGKILPYVIVGYVDLAVFLLAARILFDVPFEGSPLALFVGFNLYAVLNLALGFLISTVARNQMQAMQLSFFTILPSVLLSGFMFPFAGMPGWAQALGTIVPATHFMRVVRKVMLKGGDMPDIAPDLLALLLLMLAIMTIAMLRYRRTLD